MGQTLTEKILSAHLVEGEMVKGSEIGIRIDQTLTQDATGTMAYLEFEAMGVPRVKTERSVAYIDHNTLQNGFENADDHKYLQTVANKHGIYFSRPGNGICHQVHLERFAAPGKTLLGSDSHTPTAGGIGALALASGMAAITYSIQTIAEAGDNIASVSTLYGGTYNLFAHTLPKQGIEVRFFDYQNPEALRSIIDDKTKLVFVESIGNPLGNIIDLEAIAKKAAEKAKTAPEKVGCNCLSTCEHMEGEREC